MFLLTPSLLTVILTVVLTVVVGTEYYSGLPTAEDKHLYEYGYDTDDTVQANVDDSQFRIEVTHPIIMFGTAHTQFKVSYSHG